MDAVAVKMKRRVYPIRSVALCVLFFQNFLRLISPEDLLEDQPPLNSSYM